MLSKTTVAADEMLSLSALTLREHSWRETPLPEEVVDASLNRTA